MSRTFDGPNNDDFIAPVKLTVTPRKSYPFRQDLTAVLYQDDFIQRAEYFEPLALDQIHPQYSDAYLVNESDPALESDGLVRFTRSFATVPADRTEFGRGGFTFPAYKTLSADTAFVRNSFTQTVVAKIVFSYLLTTDPGTELTITNRFQPLDADDEVVEFVATDSTPTLASYQTDVTAGNYIQSDETEITRWMGNIWQMRNLQVIAL